MTTLQTVKGVVHVTIYVNTKSVGLLALVTGVFLFYSMYCYMHYLNVEFREKKNAKTGT